MPAIKMLKIALLTFFSLSVCSSAFSQTVSFSSLYIFQGGTDGGLPTAGPLALDSHGSLFGVTDEGRSSYGCCGVVYKIVPATGVETVLHKFSNGDDGTDPYGGVIRDSAGNLFGTTAYGGSSSAGVVYELSSNRKETILYTFDPGRNEPNPPHPEAGLVEDAASNLYGTATAGSVCCGVVFKLDASGNYTSLHTFGGEPYDGANPQASLVMDQSGNLYGTTQMGGSANLGTVFSLNPTNGNFTILHSFTGPDGENPISGLTLKKGFLYGVAQKGGAGFGVAYKISVEGAFTSLYTFMGGTDGGYPNGALAAIDGESEYVYGTAEFGGNTEGICQMFTGCGVIFQIDTSSGQESVLYPFTGLTDGFGPEAGLIASLPAKGTGAFNLFGTTFNGGTPTGCNGYGCGTVFALEVTP